MTTKIYTLSDPITGDVKYVGKTNNPAERLKNHLNKLRDYNTKKRLWINSLRLKKLRPIFTIIAEVPIENWQEYEKFYIKKYKDLGCDLVNYTDGGDGLTFGNQTSFKKGYNARKVVALEKDGTYFNTFSSSLEAYKIIKVKGISSVLAKVTKTCGGYIWLYEEEYLILNQEQIDELVKYTNDLSTKGGLETRFAKGTKPWNTGLKGIKLKPNKNVHQYTLERKFIKTWETAKIASDTLLINCEGIGQCARNKAKSGGGYYWTYNLINKIEFSTLNIQL